MRDYTLYLKDILAAIESIESFIAGMNLDTFQTDDKTVPSYENSKLSGKQ